VRSFLIIVFIVALSVATASAQSERTLNRYFEGKQITLRIAIPETKRGVDLYPERAQPLNIQEYTERLRESGVLYSRGEKTLITKVEVHSNRIEIRLGADSTGFNIHFSRLEAWMLTPATVVDALGRYVEFNHNDKNGARLTEGTNAAGYVRKGVVHIGPRGTYLKEGLSPEEVVSLLGAPTSIFQSKRDGHSVVVYEFQRSGDRVFVAEFVNGSLIASRTEKRSIAQGIGPIG
jgi:hypothetical protein